MTMYSKVEESTPIKSSASLLCNNLSVWNSADGEQTKIAIIHKAILWIFDPKEVCTQFADGGAVPYTSYKQVMCKGEGAHSSSSILQAKWCILPQRTVLVITSVKGAQMFEEDGSVMVFWQSLAPNPTEGVAQYARGISAVGDNFICIGTADGNILVFDVPAKGTSVKSKEPLEAHEGSSICDIASDGDNMVSTDESGKIIVWKAGVTIQKVTEIDGYGYPCSSICLWKNLIIGGYGTGKIRIFNGKTWAIMAEISAHARWINAISIARDSGMLASVSEDTFVRVWKITADRFNIEFIYQYSVTDVQLCGTKFLDQDGTSLAVTGYDSNEVYMFNKATNAS